MNQSQFQQAAGLSAGLSPRWFPHIDAAMKEFGITATNGLAMFIAQVGHESAGFTSLVESFNYSVEGLKKTFGKRLTPYQCEMLGRVDGKQVAHQPQIANLVYGDRMGNNSQGDGWKYRGRGYIQLTGKDNYAAFNDRLPEDIASNPDLVATKYPMLSAALFWDHNKINAVIDNDASVYDVTRKVNGGLNGIEDRMQLFEHYSDILYDV